MSDEGLRGEWIVEAAAPPAGEHTWMSNPKPMRQQMPIGVPSLDDGRLLFTLKGSPVLSEFRLIGEGAAVCGAAVDKLPPEFTGPEFERSIEGHRVRFSKTLPTIGEHGSQ